MSSDNGNEDEDKEIIAPYSLKYETWYFFSKGIPLMFSAVLEWGVPPWAGMAFAGHTRNSSDLQTGLGYARVFYNITTLMTLFSMTNYFATVLPGAIGAGRHDRVRLYFQRSVAIITLLWLLFVVPLQLFAGTIMHAVGVPATISNLVGTYSMYMIPVGWMLMLEVHLELIFINLGFERCAAFNSLLTGLGVDITCTYFFVYRWEWGIKGVALSQVSVKAARILVWVVLTVHYRLQKYFYGTEKILTLTLNSDQDRHQHRRPLLLNQVLSPATNNESKESNESNESKNHNDGNDERGVDPFFSWVELQLFWDTFAPTLATFFTGNFFLSRSLNLNSISVTVSIILVILKYYFIIFHLLNLIFFLYRYRLVDL